MTKTLREMVEEFMEADARAAKIRASLPVVCFVNHRDYEALKRLQDEAKLTEDHKEHRK